MAIKQINSLISTADISAYFKQFTPSAKSDDRFFRSVNTKSKQWSTATLSNSYANLAGGLISNNSTAPIFSRPTVDTVLGSMVVFGGGFEMTADEIDQFNDLKYAFEKSGNAGDAQALIAFYGNDLNRINGLMKNEKAALNWGLLSNACSITATLANTSFAASMAAMAYPVSAWQKQAVGTTWSNVASTIVTDVQNAVDAGMAQGKTYTRMFVNKKTFGYIRKNTEVQNACASRVSVLLSATAMPNLEQINMMFEQVCGVQVIVVEDLISRESVLNVTTTTSAFADDVAVFAESDELGRFEYNLIPIIDGTRETYVDFYQVGNMLEINPSKSTIYGKARGFSVIDSYADNYYLKTNAVAWS